MIRSLRGCVVVITEASSGIGRGVALAFAREGASVVLAARGRKALRRLAELCESLGGRAVAVPTNVADEKSVEELAVQAVERFGRIDVWVNNAGLSPSRRFEASPSDAYRRMMQKSVFGCMHGARAALSRFKAQGKGTLVNNASVQGIVPASCVGAYAAILFAIRGFSDSLLLEFKGAGIDICTVLPSVIDIPVKAIAPMTPADKTVAAVLLCASRPKPEVVVGVSERFLRNLHRASQRAYARFARLQSQSDRFRTVEQARGAGGGGRRPAGRGLTAAAVAGAVALPASLWWLRHRAAAKGETLWRR